MFMKTGEMLLPPHIKNEIVQAYMVEHPHYHYTHTCPACVAEMLVTVYKWLNKKLNG